jgi:O-antigen/teichoic acid export membrane protein
LTEPPNSPALSGRERFLGSAACTAASRVLLALLSIGTLAVLTRLLRTSDFGVLAMALVFANLAQRFQDMGAGLALIQIRDIGRDAQRVGFTISFLASSTIAVLLILTADLVALVYDGERIVADILRALAITFPIGAFTVVPRALMRRRMTLRGEAIVTASSTVVESIVTIALAWIGWGVAALVTGRIAAALATSIGLAVAQPWSPGLRLRGGGGRFMARFGGGLTVSNLLFYAYSNADFLLIGRILSDELLGIYNVAWRVAKMPWDRLWVTINPLILPSLSRHRDDPDRMGRTYTVLSRYLAMLSFPALGGLAACADDVVEVLFDPQFAPAIGPLRLLCVFGMARAAVVLLPPLLTAREQIRSIVWFNGVAAVLLPLAFWYSLRFGVVGPAWVWAVLYPLLAIGMLLPLAVRVSSLRAAAFFRSLSVPAFATGLMAATTVGIGYLLPEAGALRLALRITAGVVVYATVVIAIEGPVWREFLAMARDARRGMSA